MIVPEEELDEEGTLNGDIDTAEAQEVLSWRPGICLRPLPSKGGPKFFGYTGASYELRKVDEQLKQYTNVLHSKKVRKTTKLGKAEWMRDRGLAKVTKQGKFIQTMGHHNGEFFALHPEEALFLLDIGDIELTIADVPLSLQEAFSVTTCIKSSQFTLDDYTAFSHLVKRGFIVRHHGVDSKRPKYKRRRSSTDKCISSGKLPKLDDQKSIADKPRYTDECEPSTSQHHGCREWYIRTTECKETTSKPSSNILLNPVNEVAFPNLATRLNNHLPAPSENLLPAGIPSSSYFIDNIWFERINKDNGKQHLKYSGSHGQKKLLRNHKCKNWSEYKAMRLEAEKAENTRLQNLQHRVTTWEVKPLILPGTSSVQDSLLRIKTIMGTPNCTELKTNSDFYLRYNVYEATSTPFKKTNPGRANFVVIVTNAQTPPPTSLDIQSLLRKSKGVPIRFAVVDDGQVSFYEFEMTNISAV